MKSIFALLAILYNRSIKPFLRVLFFKLMNYFFALSFGFLITHLLKSYLHLFDEFRYNVYSYSSQI